MKKKLYLISVEGINYLIDKDAEIKDGELYWDENKLKIKKYLKKRESFPDLTHRHKLVAIKFPNKIEGLLQYKLENELDNFSKEFEDEMFNISTQFKSFPDKELIIGFTHDGRFYTGILKTNKALYTEEQVLKAQQAILCNHRDAIQNNNFIIEYLQSLNKPKEIESVEIDYKYNFPDGLLPSIIKDGRDIVWQPVLNSEGLLIINKINYK